MCKLWLLVGVFLLFLLPATIFGQATSNKGKDFYLPYSAHVDGKTSRMNLILSADYKTNYKISVGNTVVASGTINANSSAPIVIDPNSINVYIESSEVVESNMAVHVETDMQISLYCIIYNNNRTGGTMVIPTTTLGKEYYVFSHENLGNKGANIYSEFSILGTVDNTLINIVPKQTSRTGGHTAGVPFSITLNKGQIYQYQAVDDLSGTYISSDGDCKPIAVFSGNSWVAFCESGNSRTPSGGDNLYQQLFPVSAWGKNFVTSPFFNTLHGNTDAFRIIVAEDNTYVTVNGSTTSANGTTLTNPYKKGSIINFYSTGPNVISSDRSIALAHYQTSQTCNPSNTGANANAPFPGDPEITVLNPVEQTLNDITVFSDIKSFLGTKTNINKYFINVVIKTAEVASFKLDGTAYSSSFVPIANSDYSYAVIDVTGLQAQHRLTASGGFSAIAYGYGVVESYAYLAGANVQSYTFQATDLAENTITSGCAGDGFKVKINLTGEATELIWNLDGANTIKQTNPVAIPTTKDGLQFYTYNFPDEIDIHKAGDYNFSVQVTYKNANNCGNMETISSGFIIYEKPDATFNVSERVCLGNSVTPVIVNGSTNAPVTKWKWQFDDEVIETESPTYTFKTIGSHIIKLSVSNSGGCWSDVIEKKVEVYPVSQSKFDAPAIGCVNAPVTFTDQSTVDNSVNTSSISFWKWDFNDGTNPETRTDSKPFTHVFTKIGAYTVKLYTTSSAGCSGTIYEKRIDITAIPTADFTLPDVCSSDGLTTFVNISVDASYGAGTFTYKWDFGDPASGANTSTERDGKHQYVNPGPYEVKLTIINSNGCENTSTKSFIVNGRVDKAEFMVLNIDNLCSNNDVVLRSGFTALVGKVVKLEIYKDYTATGVNTITKTVMYPNQTDEIHLTYDAFGGNQVQKHTIRIVGYTGDNSVCTKEAIQEITLKPVPRILFNDMASVCENDGSVMFTYANETSGIIGKGIYTSDGKGMAEDGLYNPKVAGPGSHMITYTFKADNGCENAVTKTVEVYESPVTDAGEIIYILAGGQLPLPATAEGKNLTYSWSPALGLNRTDVLNPVAAPEKDTEYTLTVTTQPDGCMATSSVMVKVLQSINPPNAFTPNGDGVNDVWLIKYLESYPLATVEIFNRNGNKVFSSNGYQTPFDGNYQNEPLPVGVYYYIINPRNGRKTVTGPLTIIR
ncbi:PKD domain-containing protein [Pedobacter sp. BMA]|uniref:PKD domain-containing protein n=1 Tax=Pedobacter sp. BMA TaxID=1663685 RepID=UPI0009E3CD80|nr:PKD domain-containing protein [Pedobacter sp. BMA]